MKRTFQRHLYRCLKIGFDWNKWLKLILEEDTLCAVGDTAVMDTPIKIIFHRMRFHADSLKQIDPTHSNADTSNNSRPLSFRYSCKYKYLVEMSNDLLVNTWKIKVHESDSHSNPSKPNLWAIRSIHSLNDNFDVGIFWILPVKAAHIRSKVLVKNSTTLAISLVFNLC